MDEWQIEGFVAAAERDYRYAIDSYRAILGAEWHWDVAELREMRADVLAAQQVLELARREARGTGRRGVEEEVACPNCGRMVGRAYLFDSTARGVELCAQCDIDVEAGR